ncbi:NnrT protein [Roseovarius sp. EL26]|uniref:NnrT protein n=1 Tax=Roseovarius sp. EL26 TaxID=2126672 RepID=UPI000EA02D09|nr:NnrT protein [Roseovarius sp. EL26]
MTQTGWGVGKITAVLYPFGAGAMALNVYFASLILSWLGVPVITPLNAILVSLPLGIPATWLFARHIRGLMNKSQTEQ